MPKWYLLQFGYQLVAVGGGPADRGGEKA